MKQTNLYRLTKKAALHNYDVLTGTRPKSGEELHYIFIVENGKTIKSFWGFEFKDILTQAIE
jgi:hypothetical protein